MDKSYTPIPDAESARFKRVRNNYLRWKVCRVLSFVLLLVIIALLVWVVVNAKGSSFVYILIMWVGVAFAPILALVFVLSVAVSVKYYDEISTDFYLDSVVISDSTVLVKYTRRPGFKPLLKYDRAQYQISCDQICGLLWDKRLGLLSIECSYRLSQHKKSASGDLPDDYDSKDMQGSVIVPEYFDDFKVIIKRIYKRSGVKPEVRN